MDSPDVQVLSMRTDMTPGAWCRACPWLTTGQGLSVRVRAHLEEHPTHYVVTEAVIRTEWWAKS